MPKKPLTKCKLLLLLAILLSVIPTKAQENQGQISGTITSGDNSPIPFAAISIVGTNMGTVSNEDGTFFLENIAAGEYTLRISCIGYEEVTTPVTVSPTKVEALDITLQENAVELSSVVVTAEKRFAITQKMSTSVSALNAVKVKNAQVETLNDLTGIAPNLFVVNSGGDRLLYSMRGFYSSSYDPILAVYVDGVLQYDANSTLTHLSDVDRIEILRGPQGTLYGRNAMAGVINIITKESGNDTKGFFESSLGNYNKQNYTVAIKKPLIKDKLFVGLSGFYNKRDGYFKNTVTGNSFDDYLISGGNVSLKWKATPLLKFTLNNKYQYTEKEGSFPYALNDSIALADGYKTSQDTTGTEKTNKLLSSLALKYNHHLFNINSITAYQYTNYFIEDGIWDADWTPYNLVGFKFNGNPSDNFTSTFSEEIRFSNPGTGTGKLEWLAGAYYMHTMEKENGVTVIGSDAVFFGDDYAPYELVGKSKLENNGFALFGNTTWHVSPKFDLTAGLRYDWEEQIWDTQTTLEKDGFSTTYLSPKTISADFDAFSPKAVLTWKPNENKTYYFSYSKGYRCGGINTRSGFTDADPTSVVTFDPEVSHNWELAGKHMLLNNRLRVNLTLFYILWDDMQISTFNPSMISTSIQNAGKAESLGAELEVQYKATKDLTIDYNGGIISAEYLEMTSPNTTTFTETDHKGNTLVVQPKYTSSLAVLYKVLLGAKAHLMFRPEWQSMGKQYFDVANTIEQDAYSLFNLKVGYVHENIEVNLWGKNIFDKTYIGYGYSNSSFVMLGNPQTFGIAVRAKF